MNDGVQMGIVEIEQIGRYRVEERRAHRIDPLGAPDHRRRGGAAERHQHAQCRGDGRVVRRAQRGREKIQDRAFRFVFLCGDIRPRRAGDEIGENRADALRFILPH